MKKGMSLLKEAIRSKTVILTILTAAIAIVLSKDILSVLGAFVLAGFPFALLGATLHTTKKKTGFIVSLAFIGLIICISGFCIVRKLPAVRYIYGSPYEIHSVLDINECNRNDIHNVNINITDIEYTGFEWVKTRNGVNCGTEYYYAIIQTSAGKALLRYYEMKPRCASTINVYLTGFSTIDKQVYNSYSPDLLNEVVFISADKYVVKQHNLEKTTILFLVYSLLLSGFIGFDGIKRYRNREIYVSPATQRKQNEDNGSERSSRVGSNTNVETNERNSKIEYSTAVAMAEEICELLKSKGLTGYLLSDFTTSAFLSYGDFSSRKKTYLKLNLIFIDILRYLNLPPFIQLNVEYVDKEMIRGKTTAGSYRNTFQNKTITVKISPVYEPNNVVAILCHECTHYFMENNRLNWIDTELNEIRTDVMASLIGFGRIIVAGYCKIVDVKTGGNRETTTTHKVGYITAEECENVRYFLLMYRKEFLAQQEQSTLYKSKASELQELIDTAVQLNQLLEAIDPRINRDALIYTRENVEKLSSALYEYETRNLPAELHQYETLLNNGSDITSIETAISNLKKLCADILRWSAAFQGRQS